MKKLMKFIIPLVLIALVGTAFFVIKKKKDKPEWKTQEAEIGMIRETVTATGTINPITSVNVGTEVSGTIEKLYKDYNSSVRKGELLAKLKTETLELNLEDAKAELVKAEETEKDKLLDLNNLKELVRKNMAANYDLQKAQYNYEQAKQNVVKSQNALKRAQTNLDNATIVSPIDGVIISRSIDEGQTVAASFNAPTLFVIAKDLQKMQIDASVDEADIGKIKLGLPVRFKVDAFPDENFRGKVNQIRLSPQTDNNVVSYTVVIQFENPDLLLLPGMTANVEIVINAKADVLTIPAKAIQFRPSQEVWEAFGLVWNDSLMQRRRSGGFGGMGQMAMGEMSDKSKGDNKKSKSDNKSQKEVKPVNQMDKDQKSSRGEEGRPRFSREEFDKLSPEMKQKFIEKMRQRRERAEQSETKEQTPQTPAIDIFKLRDNAEYYKRNQTSQATVWVLENNKPVLRNIETGISSGNKLEVISGLKTGDQVIVGAVTKANKNASANNTMPFGNSGGPMGPGMRR